MHGCLETGFSLSFGVDGLDLKVGALAIECLSHHPLFPGKVGRSILEEASFLAGPQTLMRTIEIRNFSSRVQLHILLSCCSHLQDIQLNTRREIPHPHAPRYYSLYLLQKRYSAG